MSATSSVGDGLKAGGSRTAASEIDDAVASGRGGTFASLGAVGAALVSAICCAGPLLFVTFGVGAGLASTFEPFRPFFTFLTFGLLGLGFWAVYGRSWVAARTDARAGTGEACGPGEACAVPRSRKKEKAVLWGATLAALAFWSFPYWSVLLL